jgi:hypothetical protein
MMEINNQLWAWISLCLEVTRMPKPKCIRFVAPKGNQYWRVRKSHGQPRKFQTPRDLWDRACDYFLWVEQNPLYKPIYFRDRGSVIQSKIAIMRPMSIRGLSLHLGVSVQTFLNYERRESCRDYFEVCEGIRNVIFVHNFTGAAAGLLNPCVMARML